MASFTTSLSGTLTNTPVAGQSVPTGAINIPLVAISQASTKSHYSTVSASSDVNTSLSFGNVTNAKIVLIQKVSGTVTFKLTTSGGTDQILPIGKVFLLESASAPVTAIKYTGTGDFEIFLVEW